jgi:Acyl-coenzyme A:6-aminopenicillanic acid acyl-transferase
MGPAENGASQMSSEEIKEGTAIHCNHFLRLNIQEPEDFYLEATKMRYKTLHNFPEPKNKEDIINMLGDVSHKKHYIFRCEQTAPTKTICVGIFDLKMKTWSLYKDNPKHNEPLITLPLNI